MRTETPVQIKLADYTPYPFAIDQVEMAFDLAPSATKVRTKMQVRRLSAGDLVLDGLQMTLDSITLDGAELAADAYMVANHSLPKRSAPDAYPVGASVRNVRASAFAASHIGPTVRT